MAINSGLEGLWFPIRDVESGEPFLVGHVERMICDQAFLARMHHGSTRKYSHTQVFPLAAAYSMHFFENVDKAYKIYT